MSWTHLTDAQRAVLAERDARPDGRSLLPSHYVPRDGSRYDHRPRVDAAPTVHIADMTRPVVLAPDILAMADSVQCERDADVVARRDARQATAVRLANDAPSATHGTVAAAPVAPLPRWSVGEYLDNHRPVDAADVHAAQVAAYRASRPVKSPRASKWVRVR